VECESATMEAARKKYQGLLKRKDPKVTLCDEEPAGKKRKISEVWNDFQHLLVDGKDEGYVACKKCSTVLRYTSSTLFRHSFVLRMLHR